jgi:transcriptional regulator with XRE-family HTH domain
VNVLATLHIGANIAELRKAMGTKQEDVAKAAGVSAQAVSKWENGGTPDTELLPLIADYFGVSIDRLFGRAIADYSDIETEVTKYVAQPLDVYDIVLDNAPVEAHTATMERVRKICWAINNGMFGTKALEKLGLPAKYIFDEIQKNASDELYLCAEILTDAGMSLISLSKNFPYFMFFPEPKQGWDMEILDMDEYQKVFAALAEPDLLKCLCFIHTKEPEKKFSLGYFSKMTGLEKEKAKRLLDTLTEMKYVKAVAIELDDTRQMFYSTIPNHVFVMLLMLMETYMKPSKAKLGMEARKKPFLRKGEDAK